MTRSALPALALLLAAGLSACAGPTVPTDASTEDFCDVQGTLFADLDLGGGGPAPTSDDIVASLRDWADEVEEVGTPADMPDDARAGFDRVVQLARQATPEDFDENDTPSMPEMSAEEQEQATAFTAYVGETCGPARGGLPEVPEISS